MESFQRVQLMIQEARQWLDNAQESYRNSNPVRGELDLHLAQAEIQRACEVSRAMLLISHNKNVSSIREQRAPRVRYYTMGIAAAVSAIMFAVSLSLFLYSDGNRMRNHSLLGASFGMNPTVIYIQVSEPVQKRMESTQKQTVVKHRQKPIAIASEKTFTNKKNGNGTTDRLGRIAYHEASVSDDVSDDSRFYAETSARGGQWHSVSTSRWDEERLIRSSMPSFSREISNEGGR